MQTPKLFQQMTPDEQLQWAAQFGEYLKTDWPLLQPATVPAASPAGKHSQPWTLDLQRSMTRLITLLLSWPFARDFCEKAQRYGDFAARAYRMPLYIEKVQQLVAQIGNDTLTALAAPAAVPAASPLGKRKPGRPASAATLAKREAEARAAQQQTALFTPAASPAASPAPVPAASPAGSVLSGSPAEKAPVHSPAVLGGVSPSLSSIAGAPIAETAPAPFLSTSPREDTDYRLSVAQIRAFLSPDLQARADTIRTLRSQHAAASERAKTMSDMKADPKSIEPVAKEAIEAHDAYMAIYADIDTELAVIWYRLQNDSDQWRTAWLQKYGFLKPAAPVPSGSAAGKKSPSTSSIAGAPSTATSTLLHPDLLHDLRKHYQKVQSPEFDLRCRTLIEQESPEYVARQAEEVARKKEVQDILRYLKRKDKGVSEQRVKTARTKFARLQELLGKKAAADYRPLLTKIEEEAKTASSGSAAVIKASVPADSPSGKEKETTKK